MKEVVRSLIVLAVFSPAALYGQVTLTAPTPATGQAGVTTITLTGSGFPTGTIVASAVIVAVVPAGGGASTTTVATSIVTVLGSTRRVTFLLPASVAVTNPAAYKVSVAGSTSTGISFNTTATGSATLTINPPAAISQINQNSGSIGQTLTVTISGTYSNFVQGSTLARFGPDISVGGATSGSFGPVTVTNATTITANLSISPNANLAPTTVDVKTGLQQATLPNGFTIIPPPLKSSREYVYLNGQIVALEQSPSSQSQSSQFAGGGK